MPRHNTFSWSVSRKKEFDFCPRHYYWRRYGSWGGSSAKAGPEAREAFILKHVTSLSHYVGSIIHRACARFWREAQKGRWFPEEEARRSTIRALYAGIGESEHGGWHRRVSRGTHLFEHVYGGKLPEERLTQARHRIIRALAGFYNLDLVRRAQTGRAQPQVVSIERREHFTIAGTTIHVVMDLVVQEADGQYVIWDWKSGDRPGKMDRFQGAVYALYGQQGWDLPLNHIQVRIAYLQPQRIQELTLTPELLEQTQSQIEASIATMQASLRDVKANTAYIDDFPMTEDLTRCPECVFKRLCGRE